jgi:hypothetical protein
VEYLSLSQALCAVRRLRTNTGLSPANDNHEQKSLTGTTAGVAVPVARILSWLLLLLLGSLELDLCALPGVATLSSSPAALLDLVPFALRDAIIVRHSSEVEMKLTCLQLQLGIRRDDFNWRFPVLPVGSSRGVP